MASNLQEIYRQISLIASADSDSVVFGSHVFDVADLTHEIGLIQGSDLIGSGTGVQLFTASHVDLVAVSVEIGDTAADALNSLKLKFSSEPYSGRVNNAIVEAFGHEKFDIVRGKFNDFIDSRISPVAEFAEFGNSAIRGAYQQVKIEYFCQ